MTIKDNPLYQAALQAVEKAEKSAGITPLGQVTREPGTPVAKAAAVSQSGWSPSGVYCPSCEGVSVRVVTARSFGDDYECRECGQAFTVGLKW